MKWSGREQSSNIEDRRGMGRGGVAVGGGITGIVVLVLALLFGVDPSQLFQQSEPGSSPAPSASRTNPAEEELRAFTSVVLKDTEDIWHRLFREQLGKSYREPVLVLFSDSTQSGCGFASAATGPFYCPTDQKLYLDFQFFQELQSRFRAAGDFAQAYVIAHEVGHHVQNLLGVLNNVHSQQRRLSKAEANQLSVRTELQADFLAGVWAHYEQNLKNVLEPNDLEEAIGAAQAVGDDRLQKQAQGYVVPDSFTHGTSAQRARWFRRGFETGSLQQLMDPFKVSYNEL